MLEEEAALEVDDPDPVADEDPEDFVPVKEVVLDSAVVPVDIASDETALEELATPEGVVWLGAAPAVEDPVIIAVEGDFVLAAA